MKAQKAPSSMHYKTLGYHMYKIYAKQH